MSEPRDTFTDADGRPLDVYLSRIGYCRGAPALLLALDGACPPVVRCYRRLADTGEAMLVWDGPARAMRPEERPN